jgi:hypothetical protein
MNSYVPYVYLIGWSDQDMYYIGSEYGEITKIANPANLWSTYFTSSKRVKQFCEEYGDPDVIQVRKTFTNRIETHVYESKILQRLNARNHPRLLNGNNNDGYFYISGPRGPLSEEHKIKLSVANKGKTSPSKGVALSEEHKKKISAANKGMKRSDETRAKMSTSKMGHVPWNKGRNASEEHKKKISAALLGTKRGPYNKKLSLNTTDIYKSKRGNK